MREVSECNATPGKCPLRVRGSFGEFIEGLGEQKARQDRFDPPSTSTDVSIDR